MAQRATRMKPVPETANDAAVSDDGAVDILDRVKADPSIVLIDEAERVAYLAAVEADAMKRAGGDTSTKAGRDRIKSAAADIARLKVAIDDAGKARTDEWRKLTSEVNAQRNAIKPAMQAIQDRVRQPVTAWENRESARLAEADGLIDKLRRAVIITIADTAEAVQARLDDIRGINLNPDVMGARIDMATDLRDDAVKALQDALAMLREREAEQAEMARMRAAEQKRLADEARREQERAAQDQRQRDEASRIDHAREAAAQQAMADAEQRRQSELARLEADKQAEVDEANERARRAEADAQRQRDEAEAARAAEAKRQAEEDEAQRRREADRAHRGRIMGEAKADIIGCGVEEDVAKAIVTAIVAGNVRNVALAF